MHLLYARQCSKYLAGLYHVILRIIIQIWKLRQKEMGYLTQSCTTLQLRFRAGSLTPEPRLLTTESCNCHAKELRMYLLAVLSQGSAVTWSDLCFDEMTQDRVERARLETVAIHQATDKESLR